MTGHPTPPPDDAAWNAAEQWFFRLAAEDCDAAERAAFAAWLAAAPLHRRAWDDTVALFDAALAPARAAAARPAARFRRPGRRWRWAAALGVAVVALAFSHPGDWGADVVTATGERRSLTLADGSRVDVDAATAIDIDVAADGGGERRVRLRHGRAFFQVNADPARPFVVTTDHGRVRVVGTRFAVADDGVLDVAVEQGAVDVGGDGDAAPLRLGPGQRGLVRAGRADPAGGFDATSQFAWRRGQLVFRQQALADLAADLDRYWPGRVLVVGDDLAARRISGVIDLDRREAGLAALGQMLGARVLRLTPALTVLY